jgi:hypothetical protein
MIHTFLACLKFNTTCLDEGRDKSSLIKKECVKSLNTSLLSRRPHLYRYQNDQIRIDI